MSAIDFRIDHDMLEENIEVLKYCNLQDALIMVSLRHLSRTITLFGTALSRSSSRFGWQLSNWRGRGQCLYFLADVWSLNVALVVVGSAVEAHLAKYCASFGGDTCPLVLNWRELWFTVLLVWSSAAATSFKGTRFGKSKLFGLWNAVNGFTTESISHNFILISQPFWNALHQTKPANHLTLTNRMWPAYLWFLDWIGSKHSACDSHFTLGGSLPPAVSPTKCPTHT